MKKTVLNIFIIFGFIALMTQSALAKSLEAQVESHRIPAGTMLKLKIYNAVATNTSSENDQFDGMLTEDKKIGKEIVLPQGTLFRGRVTGIEHKKMLSKSAVLYLTFDDVVTPTGKQIPVSCGICGLSMNLKGGITDNGNYASAIKQNWNNAVNITKSATEWGWDINNPSKYVLAPLGAVGGATCSTVYFLGDAIVDVFKKGSDVYMHQDTEISVILTKPLDIPIN